MTVEIDVRLLESCLKEFLSEKLYEDQEVDLPIPIIFASSFKGDGEHDFLVTENLRATNYFQVYNENKFSRATDTSSFDFP